MAIALTSPGVYVQPIYQPSPPTSGAATSVTAFLGRTESGPVNEPVLLNNWGDYQRVFGGLSVAYPLSYQVSAFFNNGGGQAVVVRLFEPEATYETLGAAQNLCHSAIGTATSAGWAAYAAANTGKSAAGAAAKAAATAVINNFQAQQFASSGPSAWVAKMMVQTVTADALTAALTAKAPTSAGDIEVALGALYAAGMSAYGTLDTLDPLPNFTATLTAGPLTDTNAAIQEAQEAVAELAQVPGITIGQIVAAVNGLKSNFPGTRPAAAINYFVAQLAGTTVDQATTVATAAAGPALQAAIGSGGFGDLSAGAAAIGQAQTAVTAQALAIQAVAQANSLTSGALPITKDSVVNGFKTWQTAQKDPNNVIDPVATAVNALAADLTDAAGVKTFMATVGAAGGGAVAAALTPVIASAPEPAKTDLQTIATQYKNWDGISAAPTVPSPSDWTAQAANSTGQVVFYAASPGTWANGALSVAIDTSGISDATAQKYGLPDGSFLFNLTVRYVDSGGSTATETFLNLTADSTYQANPRYVGTILAQQSRFLRFATADQSNGGSGLKPIDGSSGTAASGLDSDALSMTTYLGDQSSKTGMYALENTPIFNILVIPPDSLDDGADTPPFVYQSAASYCVARNAMLIIDPPSDWSNKYKQGNVADISLDVLGSFGEEEGRSSAVYFPRIKATDPLTGQVRLFPNSGYLAGLWAQTDTQVGVWKAPAGLDAAFNGIVGLEYVLTDAENGQLNPLGINVLRTFPNLGTVVWGARTLRGNPQLADQYNYVSVRRLLLYIADSLLQNTKWAVFEDNDPKLWSSLTLQISTFMMNLWKQGALFGTSADQAFFVKCDATTTTQDDINNGRVNVQIGFAPVRPAEFVVITVQQLSGQSS